MSANLLSELDTKMAAIHSPSTARGSGSAKRDARNVRHEEFRALTDVYLGTDYNRETLEKVEELQIELDKQHAALIKSLAARKISRNEYCRRWRESARAILTKMEAALGEPDYIRLFGVPVEVGVAVLCPDDGSAQGTSPPKSRK